MKKAQSPNIQSLFWNTFIHPPPLAVPRGSPRVLQPCGPAVRPGASWDPLTLFQTPPGASPSCWGRLWLFKRALPLCPALGPKSGLPAAVAVGMQLPAVPGALAPSLLAFPLAFGVSGLVALAE